MKVIKILTQELHSFFTSLSAAINPVALLLVLEECRVCESRESRKSQDTQTGGGGGELCPSRDDPGMVTVSRYAAGS